MKLVKKNKKLTVQDLLVSEKVPSNTYMIITKYTTFFTNLMMTNEIVLIGNQINIMFSLVMEI